MKKALSLLIYTALLIGAYQAASSFCLQQTDGFTVRRVHSDLTFNPEWEVPKLGPQESQEVKEILSQEFHYLGCGGQCFAFTSEDDQYVIKLFKHKIRKPFTLWLALPLPEPFHSFRNRKLHKILSKLHRDFNSYKLAFERLKEETGLVYIHLNKTCDLNQTVTLVDKIGIAHEIPLDQVEFILQKKADMAFPHIAALIAKGEYARAKASIDSILDLTLSRCKKEVLDEDARIHRNFGFIGDRAVVIDVGRFRPDQARATPAGYQKDLSMVVKQLTAWLDENYPPLSSYLEEKVSLAYENR